MVEGGIKTVGTRPPSAWQQSIKPEIQFRRNEHCEKWHCSLGWARRERAESADGDQSGPAFEILGVRITAKWCKDHSAAKPQPKRIRDGGSKRLAVRSTMFAARKS